MYKVYGEVAGVWFGSEGFVTVAEANAYKAEMLATGAQWVKVVIV